MMDKFNFIKFCSLICIVLLTLCFGCVFADTIKVPVIGDGGYQNVDLPLIDINANNGSSTISYDSMYTSTETTKFLWWTISETTEAWVAFKGSEGGYAYTIDGMDAALAAAVYRVQPDGTLKEVNLAIYNDEFAGTLDPTKIADFDNFEGGVAVSGDDDAIYVMQILGVTPDKDLTVNFDKRSNAATEDVFDSVGQTQQSGVDTVQRGENEDSASWFESLITRVLAGIGDLFLRLVKLVMGGSFTLDAVIFNDYGPTIIDFWGSSGEYTSSAGIKGVVNSWFNIFRNLALVTYLVVLVYVAIKVLLVGNMGKTKQLISAWIMSVVWLFLMPYMMKYIIQVNNAIVDNIGKNRTEMLTYFNTEVELDFENAGTPGEDTRTNYIEGLRQALRDALDKVYGDEGVYGKFAESIKKVSGLERALSEYYEYLEYAQKAETEDRRLANEKKAQSCLARIKSLVANNADLLPTGSDVGLLLSQYEAIKNSDDYQGMQGIHDALISAEKAQNTDLMGEMAVKAGQTGRFVYVVIFYLLLGQLIFIALLYFKRIFMLAALIIIFPLVMVTYVIDKMGDGKAQTFSTWCKEYIVNVIVQIFHALVYVILVEAGIKIYVESNHKSWLFFLLSVMFIFPAERILRGIFGLQASTLNRLGDSVTKVFGTALAARTVAISLRNGGSNARNSLNRDAQQKDRNDKIDAIDKKSKKATRKAAVRANERNVRKAKMKDATRARKAAYAAMNAASKVRDGFAKVGQLDRNLHKKTIRGYSKFANSSGGRVLIGTGRALRRTAGIAAGTAVAFGAGGSTGDFIAGAKVAQTVGGFTGQGDNGKK